VNIFNRVFLTMLLLVLACASIAVIVLAWTAPVESIDTLRDGVNWLDEHHSNLEKGLVSSGAALIALVAILLLFFELAPRKDNEVMVTDLQGGHAYLSSAAIGQRVEEAVTQVPHVSDVRVTVNPKKKGVTVALDLHVDPDANLAAVTEEACAAARDVLTNRVHVALVEPPRARLHYRELRLGRGLPGRRPETKPATPPTVPAPPEPAATTPTTRVQPSIPEEKPEAGTRFARDRLPRSRGTAVAESEAVEEETTSTQHREGA
jgi:hypothetical protein